MTTATDKAVGAMLPNGRAAGSPDIKVEENQLPQDIKVRACKAVDEAYEITWKVGGIEDLKGKLEGLNGKVGEKVYSVAKDALLLAGNKMNVARAMFLALCAVAERHIMNKHTEAKKETVSMGKLIPQWSNYKSVIAKGLEKGLDPTSRSDVGDSLKYATAAQYREAVTKASETGTGSQAGNQRANNQNGTVLQLISRGWSPSLSAAMGVLTDGLNSLEHTEQDKVAPWVAELASKVHEFHETIMRRVTTDDATAEVDSMTPDERAAFQAALDKDHTRRTDEAVADSTAKADRTATIATAAASGKRNRKASAL